MLYESDFDNSIADILDRVVSVVSFRVYRVHPGFGTASLDRVECDWRWK